MPLSLYLFLLIQLTFVSYGDLKTKKIPNLWSLLNIVIFIVFLFVWKDLYIFEFNTFFYSIAFFVVGFGLFFLNIMGGGDSKYLASLFLMVPAKFHYNYLEILLTVTVFVGTFFLVFNTFSKFSEFKRILFIKDWKSFKNIYGKKFSFAPVILISWLIFGYYVQIWKS